MLATKGFIRFEEYLKDVEHGVSDDDSIGNEVVFQTLMKDISMQTIIPVNADKMPSYYRLLSIIALRDRLSIDTLSSLSSLSKTSLD